MMMDRQENMLRYIQENGELSIEELKIKFPNVSEMTIRRDIDKLEKENKVLRIYGGVRSIEFVLNSVEKNYAARSVENSEQKMKIVQNAVQWIKPDKCYFLDSGSTTTALAEIFPDIKCFVYTTGLTCALELTKRKNVEIFLLGGRVNHNSLSTYGSNDISNLDHINFDMAFMGTSGYEEQAGFTTGMYEEGQLKRTALQRARKRVILMDSNKIGKVFQCTFANLDEIDTVFTDENLDEATRDLFKKRGVLVL